jgi:translocation and assembly module TamB
MNRKIRIALIGIGIFSGLMTLLSVSFLFWIETDHARNFIQAKISKAIPGKILYDTFRISIPRGRIEIKNAVLKDPSDAELAGIDRLFIDISWLPLLLGNLTVAELILERPRADIRVDSAGNLNLMTAFPPSKSEKKEEKKKSRGIPLNIVVKSLSLVKGAVRYESEAQNLKAAVEEISLSGSGANLLKQSGSIELDIRSGKFESPKIQTAIAEMKLAAAIKDGHIAPLKLKLDTDMGNLSLSGTVQDVFKNPVLGLGMDLGASLNSVREKLRLKPELTGDAKISLKLSGTLNNPEVSLQLNYGGGNLTGNKIDKVVLDCQLKDRQLSIRPLQVNAASGELNLQGDVNLQKAFAQGFLSKQRDLNALEYSLSLKENNINLNNLLAGKEIKGIVNADLSVSGKGISPETMSAQIILELLAEQITASHVAAPVDVVLSAEASLDSGLATVKTFDARAGDIHLQTQGSFHLASKEIAAKLTLDASDLAAGLTPLRISDVNGSLKCNASVSGNVKQPVFDLALQGSRLRFRDIVIGNVLLNADSDPTGVVRVSKLNLENQGSVIQGGGSVHVFKKDTLEVNKGFPSDFSLAFRNIEAKDFLSKNLVSGILNGKLDIKGTLDALKTALSLDTKNLAVGAFRSDTVSIRADIEGNVIQPPEKMNLKTVLSLKAGKPGFGNINIATVALDADMKGNIRQPSGTVILKGTAIDLGAQKLRELRLNALLEGEKILIRPLEIDVNKEESLSATGWVSPQQKSYQIDVSSKGISLLSIDKVREKKVAEGKVLLMLSGAGTFDNPRLEGDIGVNSLRVKGKAIDDFNLHVRLQDHIARVAGNLNFGLEGLFHLQKKDFSASVVFDKTDLGPYFKLADQTDLAGILSGKITAGGNAGDTDHIQAAADLSELSLSLKGKEMIRSQNFKAFFKDGEISIPGSLLRVLKDGQINIEGKGKPKGGPLDFQIKGILPLRIAAQFTDAVPDISGNLNVSAQVKGNPSQPDIQADIALKDVGMTVPGLSQHLHDVNGNIRITPQKVLLDDIKGQLDDGRLKLSGDIALEAFQPADVNVKLSFNALPLKVPDMLDALLNADLRLTGTPKKSTLAGDVVILEGKYHKDVDLSLLGTLQGIGRKKRETSPAKPPSKETLPFLKNMSLDIAVKRRNPFLVENNLANLDINPDVRITGTLSQPIIGGRAKIESGTVMYQKKTFNVVKGVIDFLNPYKIEPTLDIEAKTDIRKWGIILKISGTPDQLIFKLSSDPEEEDADILSLLVMGKTTKELSQGGGSSSGMLPAQMLAEIVEKTFGDDIKKAAGLDILEVKFADENSNQGSSDGVTVTMGKELSKRMTVKYAVESKNGEMLQKGIAEYKFLENMMLTGFQDSSGAFGGEVVFRMEFR